jgi:hypothetical protein
MNRLVDYFYALTPTSNKIKVKLILAMKEMTKKKALPVNTLQGIY